jgi:hypothetical protein
MSFNKSGYASFDENDSEYYYTDNNNKNNSNNYNSKENESALMRQRSVDSFEQTALVESYANKVKFK